MSKIIRECDRRQINLRLRHNSRAIRPSQRFRRKYAFFNRKTNDNAKHTIKDHSYNEWEILHRFRGNTSINEWKAPYWYKRRNQS